MTCAQIAIMPKNKVSEASVTASSTTARTMTHPHALEQAKNIVHGMFRVKQLHVTRRCTGAGMGGAIQGRWQHGRPSPACACWRIGRREPRRPRMEGTGGFRQVGEGPPRACAAAPTRMADPELPQRL